MHVLGDKYGITRLAEFACKELRDTSLDCDSVEWDINWEQELRIMQYAHCRSRPHDGIRKAIADYVIHFADPGKRGGLADAQIFYAAMKDMPDIYEALFRHLLK